MRIFFLAACIAMLGGPALAFDDPKALVEAIYAPYQTPGVDADQDPAQFYSERLRGLVSAHAAKAAQDVLDSPDTGADTGTLTPAIGFNPFIDAKHSLLLDLAIAEPVALADRASVTVSFHNFDQATLLALSLVKDPDGWKVDDVASLGPGEHWLLSWVLQYDPFSVN